MREHINDHQLIEANFNKFSRTHVHSLLKKEFRDKKMVWNEAMVSMTRNINGTSMVPVLNGGHKCFPTNF